MRILLLLLFTLLPISGFFQELPPVINFDQNKYEAGNQNWMISQAANKNIYVANSRGLLEYTGAEWNLFPVPNNTIVRSVAVVGNRVYTGAYMEIGFWERDATGQLNYQSLVPHFPAELKDGEQFWNIKSIGEVIVFQSFEGLYIYNIISGEITTFSTPPGSIRNLFEVNNIIYFQIAGEGLFTIRNNLPLLVIPASSLIDREIMHVGQKNEFLSLITRKGEFFTWNGQNLLKSMGDLEERLRNRSVYSALTQEDNSVLIGTVEDGIYHVNEEGEILLHFNQENGLINNTVLGLFKDDAGNIWAGLDNGLSVINIDSPIKLYQDNYGNLGSVYTSHKTEDYLYLGTNQGLFYKKDGEEKFTFMSGTNGQVWSLQELDGTLFCGHNSGTYIVKDEVAKRIYDKSGTWLVIKYENNPGFYIQGHYNGISLLEEQMGEYRLVGMLEDFPHSSKFIVSEPDDDIWVGNEHKGVFRLKLNGTETSVSSTKNYNFGNVSGISSSIFKFNDTLYYSATEKLYQYREGEDKFFQESSLARTFEKIERISGKVVKPTPGEIWGFSLNSVFKVEIAQLGDGYGLHPFYLPKDLKNITIGYENLTRLSDGTYILGVSNGYLKIEDTQQQTLTKEIRIDNVFISALDETPEKISLTGAEPFHYKTNNIVFNFSIPEYKKFLTPSYSYRLLGLSPIWSPWTTASSASFKNLRFGSYEFEVKGRMGDKEIPPVLYRFEIDKPWYFSYTAIAFYILLFIILLFFVNKAYKRKHLKMIKENEKELKMKHLEAEKTIIELQNEQLEKDMINKNKELAISTMSLIKKNEFLTSIRERLKGSKASSAEIGSVIKTIDKDISEEDNWNFFKEAFNNADKDFFKKIKSLHPHLTSNDLKLCAYLRLNLTSKEIAPLLNISVKSVEIKRYRLRKKMDLPHETNLVDYILEV